MQKQNKMIRTRDLQFLKRIGSCRKGLAFARKFPSLADAWEACERADWMMCALAQGKMLNKPTALKLAIAFAKRAPTRVGALWLTRVAEAESDSDAAGDAWAASDASAFSIAYCESIAFKDCLYATELRWQADSTNREKPF
jgi:hypothetical protein